MGKLLIPQTSQAALGRPRPTFASLVIGPMSKAVCFNLISFLSHFETNALSGIKERTGIGLWVSSMNFTFFIVKTVFV